MGVNWVVWFDCVVSFVGGGEGGSAMVPHNGQVVVVCHLAGSANFCCCLLVWLLDHVSQFLGPAQVLGDSQVKI
jgi:hypothetical protein